MGKRAPHHLELTNASARVLDCTKADFLSPPISSSTLAAKGKPGGKHFQERPPGSASQSVPPPAPINASLRKIPAQARPARSPGKAQGLQRAAARQNILPHRSTQLTTPAERGLKWGREKEMTQEPFSSGRLRYPGWGAPSDQPQPCQPEQSLCCPPGRSRTSTSTPNCPSRALPHLALISKAAFQSFLPLCTQSSCVCA